MKPLLVKDFTASSCIGLGVSQTLESLLAGRSGLKACDFETVDIDTRVGEISRGRRRGAARRSGEFDCRNNRLAELALAQDGFLEDIGSAARLAGTRGE